MSFSISIASSQNGTYTDITSYIAEQGVKWSLNAIDAANSGRDTLDGLMHRALVTYKVRLDITCRPLTSTEASTILTLIKPEWIWVKYLDVQTNTLLTKKMYSNNLPATYLMLKGTTEYWTGIAFPLIEQ